MKLTNPIILAGKDWTHLSVQMAINGRTTASGGTDASVALRLIPNRINEDGVVESLDTESINTFRGSFSELKDSAEVAAVTAIATALNSFVIAKGY